MRRTRGGAASDIGEDEGLADDERRREAGRASSRATNSSPCGFGRPRGEISFLASAALPRILQRKPTNKISSLPKPPPVRIQDSIGLLLRSASLKKRTPRPHRYRCPPCRAPVPLRPRPPHPPPRGDARPVFAGHGAAPLLPPRGGGGVLHRGLLCRGRRPRGRTPCGRMPCGRTRGLHTEESSREEASLEEASLEEATRPPPLRPPPSRSPLSREESAREEAF